MKTLCRFLLWLALLLAPWISYPPLACAQDAGDVSLPILFDQYGAVMLMLDADTGEIIDANQAALRFYGYSREKLLTMNIADINTLSPDQIANELNAVKTGQRNNFVFEHRLASGEIRSVEVYSYSVSVNGRMVMLSTVNDITDRLLLESNQAQLLMLRILVGCMLLAALLWVIRSRRKLKLANISMEKTNQLLKTFIDAQGDLVYMKDDQLRYVFVNKAFEQFYQRTAEQVIGKDDFALSEADFAQLRRNTDLEVFEKKEILHNEIIWNGRVFATTKFPVQLEQGRLGVGAYVRDITRQRQDERHRQMATQRMMILGEMVSHPFSNTQERLDYVLNETLKLSDSKYGFIYLYDEPTQLFTMNTWSRDVMNACSIVDPLTPYHLDQAGLWGEAIRRRKPFILNDFNLYRSLFEGASDGHVTLTRFLSIPVIMEGSIVAVLGLANKPSDYDENDVYELSLLMSGSWSDIKRHEYQVRLTYERSRYLQTLISIGDAVMVVGADGRVEMLNPVAEKLTGWCSGDAVGRKYPEVFDIRHESDGGAFINPVEAAFATGEVQTLIDHTLLTSKSGLKHFVEDSVAPIRNATGEIEGVVLVFRDVTAQKAQLQQIEYLSFHDALTGLYNRRFFNEELARLDAPRNLPLCILMGDLDGLKLTNDIFGHAYGDQLLERIAHVFRSCCRADDIIARWGGDEFVMILPHTTEGDARQVMARIEREVARERVKVIRGSISMGLACKYDPQTDVTQVLTMAEEAMYSVKSLKRGTFRRAALDEIIGALHQNSEQELSHSQNVSKLAQRFGEVLELPADDVTHLRDAGYYHDIGKVVLDARLLTDQPFSDLEWNEIRQHPVVGYRILNSFDHTVDLAEIALAHQERWDGSGYPKGLRGEEIPLFARIIAIAEKYDRLLRHIQGDPGAAQAAALRKLRQAAGAELDPVLVQRFIDMIDPEPRSE